MNTTKLTVCKANQLIEATYRLSLNEQRVINACIAQIDSVTPLLATDKFELSAKDFAKLFSISEDRAYSELQDIAKTLYQRSVTVHNPDPTQPKLKKVETRWISTIGYVPEDGKIYLHFSQYILPYLSELKGQFTKYELNQISGMTCIYAYRLYELLMQWKTTGKREIEIEWLKKHFELDESYTRMNNFKARVIDPAVKDINKHSNFNVTWEQRKTGRRVTHLIFTFAEKQATPLKEKPKKSALTSPKETTDKPRRDLKQTGGIHNAVDMLKGLKSGLESTKVIDPIQEQANYNKNRLEIIKSLVSTKKEEWLIEFKTHKFVTSKAVGIILEPDLKAAGLFD